MFQVFAFFFCGLVWAAPEKTALSGSGTRPLSPHAGSGVEPHFSIYFDLLLASQPGKAEFSFLNFHPLLFFEILPSSEIQFSFEVNPSPRYFELDYQLSETLQLRAGKIWIPFDDLNPHNLFGGRIGTNRMRLGGVYFLPDVWTDLGVGAKLNLSDTGRMTSEAHLYIVNGFRQGESDPFLGPGYPSFTDSGISEKDNNSDKAVGARLQFLFERVFGFGISAYTGRWNDETKIDDVPLRMNLLGTDFSMRFQDTSVRLGIIGMFVALPNEKTYRRHGEYVEFSQKFSDVWRFMLRAGNLDTDDRLTDMNDVTIVGAGLFYKPSVVQLSLEHQVDVKTVGGKAGYTFTFARVTVQM